MRSGLLPGNRIRRGRARRCPARPGRPRRAVFTLCASGLHLADLPRSRAPDPFDDVDRLLPTVRTVAEGESRVEGWLGRAGRWLATRRNRTRQLPRAGVLPEQDVLVLRRGERVLHR
jgi:hypothetical protein